jgi:adenosylhomocysteine nucleosidase
VSEAPKRLVCFALKEEARAFQRLAAERSHVRVILVGVGKANAEKAIRAALAQERPGLVLTCGFAGGLKPGLNAGAVVFDCDATTNLGGALLAAGAEPARFHCADRVAATVADKQALREATGADVVEMESGVICAVCRQQGIPSLTVRVVLDVAGENLPLDFDRLMGPTQRLNYWKLAWVLLGSPGKIGALLRLQKQAQTAAAKLAAVLDRITAA